MKQYEEVFFALVRTALWKAPLEVPEGFRDWGSVMKLAKSQAMTGLVADVLLRSPQILSTLPERFVARLQEVPLENMGVHTVLNNTLIMVVTRLREHGIEPVLLKGQGLASYYPVPQLRQCGDIDLYVGVENYEKAYEVLEPVVTEIDDKAALKVGKHFHLRVGAILIEIHKYAHYFTIRKDNELFNKLATKGLNHNLVPIQFRGISIYTPADDFNIFYVFNHLYQHYLSAGIGIRQICDLACLLNAKHDAYNYDYLNFQLRSMNMTIPWEVFGCVLVEFLGLPRKYFPFYNDKMTYRADLLVKQILHEGNFGHQVLKARQRKKLYWVDKLASLKWHTKRICGMFRIFPRHMVIRFHHMLIEGFRQVSKDFTRKR